MEVIKKIIPIESLITRQAGPSYGSLTASTIYLNVFLKQDIRNIGLTIDVPFVDIPVLSASSFSFVSNGFTGELRLSGATTNDYFSTPTNISGITDSKLVSLKTYDNNNPYVINFDSDINVYQNYQNNTITGHSRVTNITTASTEYVIDQPLLNIGTNNATDGFLFTDYNIPFYNENKMSSVIDTTKSQTKIEYKSQGWNNTNTSVSGIVRSEMYFGLTEIPTVSSDVNIDRGVISPNETILRLSEITSVEQFASYGNGFFKVQSIGM